MAVMIPLLAFLLFFASFSTLDLTRFLGLCFGANVPSHNEASIALPFGNLHLIDSKLHWSSRAME
jgi:hypothetical protein